MAEIERPHHVGDQHLSELLTEAAESTRRRSHLLLHANHQDQVQRLLIALEADSYIQPHMHSEQWEMLGYRCAVSSTSYFSAQKQRSSNDSQMNVAAPIVQIPRSTWHTAVAFGAENAKF